ncbi:hypothetical protein ACIOG4_27545 [Streptomyces microflavus]|uniref:hypothetical protein n=1 Tax=Streptomyces microflavus TaxID=1919 RepID=UPI00380A15A3
MSNIPLPLPATAPCPACTAAGPAEPAGRFGATHALILLIAVLGLGSALFLAGTPLRTVFALLGGLGAIGAATLAAAGGGRRLLTAFAETLARSVTGGRP